MCGCLKIHTCKDLMTVGIFIRNLSFWQLTYSKWSGKIYLILVLKFLRVRLEQWRAIYHLGVKLRYLIWPAKFEEIILTTLVFFNFPCISCVSPLTVHYKYINLCWQLSWIHVILEDGLFFEIYVCFLSYFHHLSHFSNHPNTTWMWQFSKFAFISEGHRDM